MYFNGYFNLDDWDTTASYIILDDIPWERVPVKKALFGAQKQFVLTDKYRKKLTVIWGKALIFLYNSDSDPFRAMTLEERAWYDENCLFVNLLNKMY